MVEVISRVWVGDNKNAGAIVDNEYVCMLMNSL